MRRLRASRRSGGAPGSICRAARSQADAYAGNAPPYQLVVVDRTGSTQTLGTWNLPTGRDITFTGGTSLPADRIQEVKVTTLNGEDLLVGWP